jgi:hypothetical protein
LVSRKDQMRAYLVRIGVDQAFGGWNAPMNPETREFVYVPIGDGRWRKGDSGTTSTESSKRVLNSTV